MSKTSQTEFPWAWEKPKRNAAAYTAIAGNVRVPVYKYSRSRYCVAWRQPGDHARQRETYPTLAAARTRADEVATSIANSLADVVTLDSADRDNYRRAVQLLEPLGIPLLTAVEEFAAARAKISPHTFMEAADFFATKFVAKKEVPSTLAILDRLCAKIQDDGRDKKLYIDRLKKDGERIAAAFPDLSRATEEGFRRYLRELKTTRQVRDRTTGEMIPKGSPVGPRRRDNVRDCAVTIMRYAVEIEALPAGKTCVERISSVAFGGEVTTYEATQLAQILDYFRREDADWLPWAAIQGLAGLRTSEILRLSWAAFKWASNAIAIHAKVAKKVRVSRQAPITPALASWLNDWRHSTGPVIPRKWKDIEAAHTDALARLRKNLGWTTWGNNALRHSFGSHRVAITKSIAQVALEMGNSPQKVRENYNDPKTEDEATAYFGVFPPSWGAKIVSIRAGAAKI